MDLCAAFPEPGCVGTGETAIATHALYTAFLGTCTAALASRRGTCAMIHYDEMRVGMRESAVACVRSFGDASWEMVRGPREAHSRRLCLDAIALAGGRVAHSSTADEARVAPGM